MKRGDRRASRGEKIRCCDEEEAVNKPCDNDKVGYSPLGCLQSRSKVGALSLLRYDDEL